MMMVIVSLVISDVFLGGIGILVVGFVSVVVGIIFVFLLVIIICLCVGNGV